MCGGAIISGFIEAKRGRKLTVEDLWSDQVDTISDLLGLDSSSNNQFLHNKLAQKPKDPKSFTKGTYTFS